MMRMCLRCGGREITASEPRKPIVCADGTKLSVQVGSSLYCTPRNDEGPWTHVEVGFPSVPPPESWEEFADGVDGVNSDVFSYVPVALVEEYIAAHGGRKVWV